MGVAATVKDESAFGLAADGPARLKGGGTGDALGLNEDRRFCADDLRRMVGRCWVSPENWAMVTVLAAQDDEQMKS